MPFDLATFVEGITALKTALDAGRSAWSMIKDFRSRGSNTEQEQKAIDATLTVASANTALAEATLGQAFGYELCKCSFPPTPMLTVGYLKSTHAQSKRVGDIVYETLRLLSTSSAWRQSAHPPRAPKDHFQRFIRRWGNEF
jgi:hypothetical protein